MLFLDLLVRCYIRLTCNNLGFSSRIVLIDAIISFLFLIKTRKDIYYCIDLPMFCAKKRL